MIIYKFGGTSLANATRMKSVADLITRDDHQKIVVLSAASGTTDTLIRLSASNMEEGKDILSTMEAQYLTYVNELLTNDECKKAAFEFLEATFFALGEALLKPLPRDEKWFVAYGEIMSTSLFSLLMVELGDQCRLSASPRFYAHTRRGTGHGKHQDLAAKEPGEYRR